MNDVLGYKGKRVCVSGCFSGMGHATAQLLIELGAEVHGFDFKECDLPLASFTKIDLRNRESIEAAVQGVDGRVDALFNCAGLPNTFPAMDVMAVNFIGLRHLTQQLLPKMGQGSAIVSIASTGGLGWSRRIPDNMALVTTDGWDAAMQWCEGNTDTISEGYAFSKENVIVWTQFIGAQLIKKGIRINCTLPSPTETPMMASFHEKSGKDVVDAAAEPMGRYSTPREQAGGLVALNSDLMSIVNGVVLPVDGGFMGALATGQIDMARLMGGKREG